MAITGKQCKMARHGLDWTVAFLADRAGVQPNTISRFENGTRTWPEKVEAIESALVASGRVTFQGDHCVCVVDD